MTLNDKDKVATIARMTVPHLMLARTKKMDP